MTNPRNESRLYRLWKFLPGAKDIADARETALANGYVHVVRLDVTGPYWYVNVVRLDVMGPYWNEIHLWCDEHCRDTFTVSLEPKSPIHSSPDCLYFMFRNSDDAFEFKMRWA